VQFTLAIWAVDNVEPPAEVPDQGCREGGSHERDNPTNQHWTHEKLPEVEQTRLVRRFAGRAHLRESESLKQSQFPESGVRKSRNTGELKAVDSSFQPAKPLQNSRPLQLYALKKKTIRGNL
jgi:hypothetical protein